jgi:hypothetical protein
MRNLLIVMILFLFACGEDNDEKVTPKIELGDYHLGGEVYYLFQEGEVGYVRGEYHGFVGSLIIGTSIWGCEQAVGAISNDDGQLNTDIIKVSCNNSNAATLCIDNGWYLPSIEEFQQLIAAGIYPIYPDYFWTSTRNATSQAYAISFFNGVAVLKPITNNYKVIGIKQF